MFVDPGRLTFASRTLTLLASIFSTIVYGVALTLAAVHLKETDVELTLPSKAPFIFTIAFASVLYVIGLFLIIASFTRKFGIRVAQVVTLVLLAIVSATIACISFLLRGTVKSEFESLSKSSSDSAQTLARVFLYKQKCSGWDSAVPNSCQQRFADLWHTWGNVAGANGVVGFLLDIVAATTSLIDALRTRTIKIEGAEGNEEEPSDDPENPQPGRAARVGGTYDHKGKKAKQRSSDSDDSEDSEQKRRIRRGKKHGKKVGNESSDEDSDDRRHKKRKSRKKRNGRRERLESSEDEESD
jgi:hypothetical protein